VSVYLIKMGDFHTRCPEPEVLAAYIDRGLSLAERSRVDHHLASCPQCLALLAGVVRTVADVSEVMPHAGPAVETASRAVTRRTLVGMLAAAAAVIAVVSAPSLVRTWQDRDAGLVNLVGVGEQRSVLGRLTGGLPHAPLGVPSAGGQGGRAAETDRILLTAAKIRESFGERETPSRLNDLGRSQLLAGQYDAAAQALLAASREQPANAQYLNDVAAVQLERARLGLRPDDLPRALASADRARRLDPSLKEAWFNRALAVSALSLHGQAKTAWTDYLARDASSAWATEARERLAELSKPTAADAWVALEPQLQGTIDTELADRAVRTQMSEARMMLESNLLPAWAAAVLDGRNSSVELDRVRAMAGAFARVAGDALYVDAVSAIERAEGLGSESLRALASAHADYRAAAALFAQDRFADAAPALAAVRARMRAAGSPFAARPALDFAASEYVLSNYDNSNKTLAEVRAVADANGYAYAIGRAAWFQGMVAFAQGRLADAEANYEDTVSTFERMGDAEQVAAAHPLLASLYFYLGAPAAEWRHRSAAMAGLSSSRSARFKYGIVATAAMSVRAENPETALLLYDEAVAHGMASGREAAVVDALAQRSITLAILGRAADAKRDVNAARQRLQNLPDPAFRRLLELQILAAESDLRQAPNPAGAAVAANMAIATIQERGDRSRLPQFYLRLAKANIARGRLDDAQTALAKGIQSFDAQRAALADEGRIAVNDESWQLFETSVQWSIKKGDLSRAFELAERARARTLAEARRMPTRSLADVQQTLSSDQAIVALSQFEDELAVWVIRHDKSEVVLRPISRLDAQRLVARQQTEIGNSSENPVASRDLYNQILRPVVSRLQGASRLVMIPDATYEDAAFAALWDESRHKFLIEDRGVSIAPSVAAFVAASTTPDGATSDEPLIIGGPNGGANAIAALYSNPSVVGGSTATPARLLAAVGKHAVVHLSVATAGNTAYPLLSRLLLADEPGRRHSGSVLGRDIAALSLPNTRLVIIDEAEGTTQNRGDGALSMARAFMTAGARAVVGTLPGADETAIRDLMVGFHRRLASGMPAGEALTELQRNVLQSNGRRVGAWSALVLYGSDR
jgi:CHAT domain-containing protein